MMLAHENITETERGRDISVRELQHRFKNNLHGIIGLLDIYRHGSPAAAAPILCDIISKVKAFAIVSDLQSKASSGDVALRQMLEEIMLSVEESTLTPTHKELALEASFLVYQNRSVPIALILNELVYNAIKHSMPGTQSAQVRLLPGADAQTVEILIENPLGGSIPALDFERGQGLGLGLELVKSLLPHGARLSLKGEGNRMRACLTLGPAVIYRQPSVTRNGHEKTFAG